MNENEPFNEVNEPGQNIENNNNDKLESILHDELSFRKAIENSIPSGLAVVDESGRQIYVNQSFCRMVGWTEEELLGQYPPYIYWCSSDFENLNNAFTLTLENKAPKGGFDLKFCHKSGKIIPVNIIISPVKQENGRISYLANVIDITERKKTERELLKSQLLLVSSIESQKNSIIFFVDRNYRYLYFNQTHRDAMKYAYNADIQIGSNMLEYMSSDQDMQAAKENFDRAFTGDSFTYLNSFGTVNRDHYEFLINPIIDDKNNIIGCTGVGRNITDRINAEQALKDSETKFKEIIDQIKDMIIVFDEKGKVIIWNNGAESTTGIKEEEALNKSIVDLQYQFTPPPYNDRELIGKLIEGIITFATPEIYSQIIDSEIITPLSDKPRNIQSTVFPINLNGSHLFCTVIRDTTEIKRYEKELIRISAEKDKFYSTITQYLYTPFSLFRNFSQLMAEELDNLPIKEIQKMAVMMSKSATNLYSLLDNMLQWTKLNQGKISFEPEQLNFKKITQDAVSLLKPKAEVNNIIINNHADDEIFVKADPYMLKTIIRNLVSNALKYTDCGGKIDINAHQSEKDAIITVFKSGTGINSEYLTKLFDISQINSSPANDEEKGTTLGLLLCKEFVEKHGGEIWVENIKGIGCEFKFTLPVTGRYQSLP